LNAEPGGVGAPLVREGDIGKYYCVIADGHVTGLQRGRPSLGSAAPTAWARSP